MVAIEHADHQATRLEAEHAAGAGVRAHAAVREALLELLRGDDAVCAGHGREVRPERVHGLRLWGERECANDEDDRFHANLVSALVGR